MLSLKEYLGFWQSPAIKNKLPETSNIKKPKKRKMSILNIYKKVRK